MFSNCPYCSRSWLGSPDATAVQRLVAVQQRAGCRAGFCSAELDLNPCRASGSWSSHCVCLIVGFPVSWAANACAENGGTRYTGKNSLLECHAIHRLIHASWSQWQRWKETWDSRCFFSNHQFPLPSQSWRQDPGVLAPHPPGSNCKISVQIAVVPWVGQLPRSPQIENKHSCPCGEEGRDGLFRERNFVVKLLRMLQINLRNCN